MQAHHQVTTAVRIAATKGGTDLLEAWLYEDDGGGATAPARIDVIDGAERLETELSFPAVVYAVVGGASRTYGIVGSDKTGYAVADMLADNFPGGPVLKGYKTLSSVVEYMCRIERGNTSFTLEMQSPPHREIKRVKLEDVPAPAPAAEPTASKPRKRAKESSGAAAAAATQAK